MAKISIPRDKLDIISAELMSLGTCGIEERKIDDSNAEILSYFPGADRSWEPRLQELVSSFGGIVSIGTLGEEDWANTWKQKFPSKEIVPGIRISPSWEGKKPDARTIVLDPGMAFGTGLHQTTRMCAMAIYDICAAKDEDVGSMLDVGCGTGILSMVAHRLGVRDITAVDDDNVAVKICRANFKNNGVDFDVLNRIPKDKSFDLVAANILLNPLLKLSDEIISVTDSGGHIILSGMTEDQEQDIHDRYDGLGLVKKYQEDEWIALVFRKE